MLLSFHTSSRSVLQLLSLVADEQTTASVVMLVLSIKVGQITDKDIPPCSCQLRFVCYNHSGRSSVHGFSSLKLVQVRLLGARVHVSVRGLWRLGVLMVFPVSANFSKNSDNLRAVDKSLIQIERAHKRAIRERDRPALIAMRRLHLLLVGVRAEASLRKIIEDPTGFNDRERNLIWKNRSQQDRWVATVDFAARRHYQVPMHLDVVDVAPAAVASRIDALKNLIEGDLSPVITDRNRLAHGQWVWQLKSRSDDNFIEAQESFDFNYCEIDCRNRILKNIYRVVSVLAVSEPTFDRDFSAIVSEIEQDRERIDGDDYEEFATQLRMSLPLMRGNTVQ